MYLFYLFIYVFFVYLCLFIYVYLFIYIYFTTKLRKTVRIRNKMFLADAHMAASGPSSDASLSDRQLDPSYAGWIQSQEPPAQGIKHKLVRFEELSAERNSHMTPQWL